MTYEHPDSSTVRTPEEIANVINSRMRNGLDASLYFGLLDEYNRLNFIRERKKKEKITVADLRGVRGRPRRLTR